MCVRDAITPGGKLGSGLGDGSGVLVKLGIVVGLGAEDGDGIGVFVAVAVLVGVDGYTISVNGFSKRKARNVAIVSTQAAKIKRHPTAIRFWRMR